MHPLCSTLLVAMIVLSPAGLAAQGADRPPPEELLEAKLESPFLKKADWDLDYDRVLKTARQSKKPILGYFTTAGY